jgi:hypothetical protein
LELAIFAVNKVIPFEEEAVSFGGMIEQWGVAQGKAC